MGCRGARIRERCERQRDINSPRKQVLPMIHEHHIDVQGRMTVLILIKLGDVLRIPARRTAAFWPRKPTHLAPFEDQGYLPL
jgi:hypothetical protein